jgi:hypothetical protein
LIGLSQNLAIFFILVFVGFSETAKGELVFGGFGGVSTGALVRSGTEKFTAFPAQGFIGYNYWQLSFRGMFQHTELKYNYKNEAYTGTHTISGVAVAYSGLLSKFGRATIQVQKPLAGSLVLLSESTGQVNEFPYLQSTLVTLSGINSMQVLAGYEISAYGRGMLRRGGNAYYGIFFSYLKHTFSTQTTRIKTNNSILAPISPGTETVSHTLTMTGLFFSATYDL